MNLELYSLFLTIACMVLLGMVAISIIGYFASADIREKHMAVGYFDYIKMIGVVSIIATLGALVYQFYYLTPVCEYCWWQRIFIFPIDFLVVGSIALGIRKNEIIIASLAVVGLVFASLHYYFHVKAIIFAQEVSLPCSSIGIIPSCTESPVLVFGFVTIPLMAVVALVSVLWLCFLAYKKRTA